MISIHKSFIKKNTDFYNYNNPRNFITSHNYDLNSKSFYLFIPLQAGSTLHTLLSTELLSTEFLLFLLFFIFILSIFLMFVFVSVICITILTFLFICWFLGRWLPAAAELQIKNCIATMDLRERINLLIIYLCKKSLQRYFLSPGSSVY